MGGACSTRGEKLKYIPSPYLKTKNDRDHLVDIGVNGRIT